MSSSHRIIRPMASRAALRVKSCFPMVRRKLQQFYFNHRYQMLQVHRKQNTFIICTVCRRTQKSEISNFTSAFCLCLCNIPLFTILFHTTSNSTRTVFVNSTMSMGSLNVTRKKRHTLSARSLRHPDTKSKRN